MLKNFKNYTTKVASFLRLIDKDHKMSLSNIAVMIALFKFATAANAIEPLDFGALLATLLNYSAKKVIGAKAPSETAPLQPPGA